MRIAARLLLLLPGLLAAAPASEPTWRDQLTRGGLEAGRRVKSTTLAITDFFDTRLPGTLGKYNLEADFSPRLSDVTRREFIRYPVELRYGSSSRAEVYGRWSPFSPNPFKDGPDNRWGPGEGELGVRYDVRPAPRWFDLLTTGLAVKVPLGEPPVDLNDHYLRIIPTLTAARDLSVIENLRLIVRLSHDHAFDGPSRDDMPAESIRRHYTDLSPGLLFKPGGPYAYFSDYEIRHIDEPEGYRLRHRVRGGVIWDIPRTTSERWRLPGKWQAELGLRVTKEEGEGDPDIGVIARVRVRARIKDLLKIGQPQISPP
jgi:hypothetical protein